MFLVGGVHAVHQHRTAGGQQNRVKMLGKRGFSGAVVSQNRDKAALFDPEIHAVQHDLGRFIGICIFKLYRICLDDLHTASEKNYIAESHIAVAPQGTTSPFAVTGRPISSAAVLPPRPCISVAKIYCMTAGDSPVV